MWPKKIYYLFYIFPAIFSILGAIFLSVGFFLGKSTNEFKEYAVPGQATIVDITSYIESSNRDPDEGPDIRHVVYVEHVAQGRTYAAELNYYSSSMRKGQTVDILYDPLNPAHIMHPSSSYIGPIFMTIGGFSLFGGLAVMWFLIRGRRRQKYLVKNGLRVEAPIIDVRQAANITINGKNPYFVLCRTVNPLTGEMFEAKSGYLLKDPTPSIMNLKLNTLPVFIDQANPAKYYVSLEGLEL